MTDERRVDNPETAGEIEIIGRTPAPAGQPYLVIGRTSNYKWLWSDERRAFPRNLLARVTVYQPEPQDPAYRVIGFYAQRGAGPPDGSTIIVKSLNDPDGSLLKEPDDYVRIWTSEGSHCVFPGAIWRPVITKHDNFVVMGHVATKGFDKPPLNAVRCVHNTQVQESRIADKIYSDQGTHSQSDFTLYSVDGLSGVFVSQPNYDPPRLPTFRFKTVS